MTMVFAYYSTVFLQGHGIPFDEHRFRQLYYDPYEPLKEWRAKTLDVVQDETNPPYIFYYQQGQPQGNQVDQWNLFDPAIGRVST